MRAAPLPGWVAMAKVTAALDVVTTFELVSSTLTTGWVAKLTPLAPPTGWVVKTSLVAAPATIDKFDEDPVVNPLWAALKE